MFLPTINPAQSTSDDHPLLCNALCQHVLHCAFSPPSVISRLHGKQRCPWHINTGGSLGAAAIWDSPGRALTGAIPALPGHPSPAAPLPGPVPLREGRPWFWGDVGGRCPAQPRSAPRSTHLGAAGRTQSPRPCRGRNLGIQKATGKLNTYNKGRRKAIVGQDKEHEKNRKNVKMLLVAASPAPKI